MRYWLMKTSELIEFDVDQLPLGIKPRRFSLVFRRWRPVGGELGGERGASALPSQPSRRQSVASCDGKTSLAACELNCQARRASTETLAKGMAVINRIFVAAIALAFAGVLTSCAPVRPPLQYYASFIDSFAQPDALVKKRYRIFPGSKNVDPSDLQYLEFAKYVGKILDQRGLVNASSFDDAEVAIFLSYGIGNPQTHQYSYSLPVWGQTGVSSSNTVGTISAYGNSGIYSGTTTYTPTYGITGYTNQVRSYSSFTRFLLMDAYDLNVYKQTGKMAQVWKANVTSTGPSGDLRLVLPYMAVAVKNYIGRNTTRQVEEDVLVDDPQVWKLLEN